MRADDERALGREAPFPAGMQGRWVEEGDPTLEVVISGHEITWRGTPMDYQEKLLTVGEEGALMLRLEVDDEAEDWQAITLFLWPTGTMGAMNDDMAANFVRPGA